MIGRAISHYRVLSTLGSGGMGVVYLAEDERLGRQVALKFLPADAATSRQALDRFRIEARAASSLSHPGICAIYDIGEDEGTPYIVMEALKGESLRDRINRGQIKVPEMLDIGIQLADALDAAHAQGIIHRDIKPSNIFIGDKNRVKILDFGLAKLAQAASPISSGALTRGLDASTHRELTMPGSALGTVSYMSPEQARGEEVDTRTDLFSMGVVLYEMATGVQAFGGSTHAVVFDAILNRAPQRIAHLNPLVPPRLEALIGTALEKERDLRHQHASDIEAELKRIRRDLESGSLTAATSRTSVSAVRPAPLSASAAPSQPAVPQKKPTWRYGVSALAVLVVAALSIYMWLGPSRGVPPNARTANSGQATTVEREAVPAVPPASGPPAAEPAAASPQPQAPAPARPDATAGGPGRGAQQPQPSKPGQEVRPQASQPVPPRPSDFPPPPAPALPSPTVTPAVPSPSNEPANGQANAGQKETPAAAPTPLPTPPAAEPPAVQTPPRTAAATPPPIVPPSSPVESDDVLIRRVIGTYERSIETKSVDLFRSARPGLSAAEEARLRESFRQVDSQQVDIVVESVRIEGRTATARLTRRDTIVSGGRRQTQLIQQTLRFEKTPAGWVITDIGR